MTPVDLPNWFDEIRRTEVNDRIRADPRSVGDTLYGLDFDAAKHAIGYGQANFDETHGNLNPSDLALLYARVNQKRHVEELTEALRQYFKNSDLLNPIVVDIGCGPFTGGLAFAAALPEVCFEYIGVDQADSMRILGERLASSSHMPIEVERHWASSLAAVSWNKPPSWSPVIVILSYVFASPTFDVGSMFDQLMALLSRLGYGDVTVLYTNSPREEANEKYSAFQERLVETGFQSVADSEGLVVVRRWQGQKQFKLRYAMFYRGRQRTLPLGN